MTPFEKSLELTQVRPLVARLLAALEAPGDLDEDARRHLIEDAHHYLDREERVSQRRAFSDTPPGRWRQSDGELVDVTAMSDDHLAAVLRHVRARSESYVQESMPTPFPHMGMNAEDGYCDALDEWGESNDTRKILAVARVRSVLREAIRRGWEQRVTDEFGLARPWPHRAGWQTAWVDEFVEWDEFDLRSAPVTEAPLAR